MGKKCFGYFFQIAGDDKIFKDAFVTITGNKLIISSPEVKEPKAVRYCWSDIAESTLFNEAGLPASSSERIIGTTSTK